MSTMKLNNMTLAALEARLEELKAEAKLVKAAIAAKRAEAILSDAQFKAAWDEAMTLFMPRLEEWKAASSGSEEWNALSLKEKAALLQAGVKAPTAGTKLEYVLIRSNPGQDVTGWEDGAKVLLARLIEANPGLEGLGLYVHMAVRKPAEQTQAKPASKPQASGNAQPKPYKQRWAKRGR